MSEMKTLTLNGKTYDSFVDKEAREAIEDLKQTGSVDMPETIQLSEWEPGWVMDDGAYSGGGTGCTSGYAQISKGKTYTIVYPASITEVRFAIYDSNKNYIRRIIDGTTTYTAVVDGYVRITAVDAGGSRDASAFSEVYLTAEVASSDNQDTGGANYSFLHGLKYYAIGDSIVDYQGTTASPETYSGTDMQGNTRDETVIGYIQAIEKRYGLVCTNFGNAGGTLPGTYGNLANKDFSDVALVTIAYGVNDARTAVPLGDVNSTDIATFAGALNNLLRKIYTDNPECRVVVLTPIQRLYVSGFGIATPNENGKYLIDFVNMCKAVAEKRSTACVDMYRTCGINQTNLAYYTREGVHPLNTGYLRMTGAIIPVLDELFAVEYNPFGKMTNTGGDEQEQPETGGGDTPEAPPVEDIEGTEVDITDLFIYDGKTVDGYGNLTTEGTNKYQTARFIPEPNKTYTIITYAESTTTELRPFGGTYSYVSDDEGKIKGNYTQTRAVEGLTAAPLTMSENGYEEIDGVSYKKLKIVFTSAAQVTGEKWINIACVDACVDHVTCHYV